MNATPTLEGVRHKWHGDLQLQGLLVLSEAARSSRPALYISENLADIRDAYQNHPREATYLCNFILYHAGQRGLLGDSRG